MTIHEMTQGECLNVIAEGRLARLACARDNQPYVVPIYYAHHKSVDGVSYLYAFTTVGQKVEWMRANPLVCVEWDEVARHDQWESIVAFGSYEELPGPPDVDREVGRHPGRAATNAPTVADDSEIGYERQRAAELLRKHSNWWEPGCATWAASETRDHSRPFDALYYRIRLDRITGRRATPADAGSIGETTSQPRINNVEHP